jgi:hypothetical protein
MEQNSSDEVVRVLGKRARKALKRKQAADALAHSASRSAAPTQAAADVVGISGTGAPSVPNAAKKRKSMINKQQAQAGVASNGNAGNSGCTMLHLAAADDARDGHAITADASLTSDERARQLFEWFIAPMPIARFDAGGEGFGGSPEPPGVFLCTSI